MPLMKAKTFESKILNTFPKNRTNFLQHFISQSSSSTLVLRPSKPGLGFPQDRCSSSIKHPPYSRSFFFSSLHMACLLVNFLMSLYHPFLQHTQAIPIYVHISSKLLIQQKFCLLITILPHPCKSWMVIPSNSTLLQYFCDSYKSFSSTESVRPGDNETPARYVTHVRETKIHTEIL